VGVSEVLVNGISVWRDGAATGALPGRALRGAGWTH
jgi:N-acyl-D-aspartate/D-glutamate deacylase